MKLVLISDAFSNYFEDEVAALFRLKSKLQATMIYDEEPKNDAFSRFMSSQIDFKEKNTVSVAQIVSNEEMILNSDLLILHISEPQTASRILKEIDFDTKLKMFAQTKDKILIGSGAGSILITPQLLNLVRFEVFPNYKSIEAIDNELREYSKRNEHPIYSLSNGDAIIINETREYMKGSIYLFSKGQKMQVSCNC